MADYKITCCSTVDISAERLNELGITYSKCHYMIDGVDYEDDLFQTVSAEEFYSKLAAGAEPITSPVTSKELCAVFEPILAAGYDLLHIEFSSGLSACWKAAQRAMEKMKEKYPDRKIFVVDSLAASSGYGMLVEIAADYKRRGMGIEELRSWLEENKFYLKHWFSTSNLMYYKRGGRISSAAAVAGTIFKVSPLLDVNDEGKLTVCGKVRRKHVLKTLVAKMREDAQDGERYGEKCYICHSMREKDADTLKGMIEHSFPKLRGKVEIHPIGTAIGCHSGPGTIALFYLSDDKRQR